MCCLAEPNLFGGTSFTKIVCIQYHFENSNLANPPLLDLWFLKNVKNLLLQERERLYNLLKGIPFLKPFPSHANFILCEVTSGKDAKKIKVWFACYRSKFLLYLIELPKPLSMLFWGDKMWKLGTWILVICVHGSWSLLFRFTSHWSDVVWAALFTWFGE